MSDLKNLLRGLAPVVQQGRVITVTNSTATVNVGGVTRRIRRTTALALKPGDRVNLQGDTLVGKRKPPPIGATYQV